MAKIIGNTTATPNPKPDWAQTDPAKADFIKNKPTIPSIEGLASEEYIDSRFEELIGAAPKALDTLEELSKALGEDANFSATVLGQLENKVDKVDGKGLSTNDFTNEEKQKLGIFSEPELIYTKQLGQSISSHRIDLGERNEITDTKKNYNYFAVGYDNKLSGRASFAAGQLNEDLGTGNAVFGQNNKILENSTGNTGDINFIAGTGNTMVGDAKYNAMFGIGNKLQGKHQGATVVGYYNEYHNDFLFVVGNGTSDTDRSNAFVVNKDGSINVNGNTLNDIIGFDCDVNKRSVVLRNGSSDIDVYFDHNNPGSWDCLYGRCGKWIYSEWSSNEDVTDFWPNRNGLFIGLVEEQDGVADYCSLTIDNLKSGRHILSLNQVYGSSGPVTVYLNNTIIGTIPAKVISNPAEDYTFNVDLLSGTNVIKFVCTNMTNSSPMYDSELHFDSITIVGNQNVIHDNAHCSVALGGKNVVNGTANLVAGYGNTLSNSNISAQTVVGQYNDENTTENALFVVGNGTSNTDRKNVFVVNKDNSITVNGINFTPEIISKLVTISSDEWREELKNEILAAIPSFANGEEVAY